MKQGIDAARGFISLARYPSARKILSLVVLAAGALAASSLLGVRAPNARSVAPDDVAEAPAVAAGATVAPGPYGALLVGIRYRSRSTPDSLAQSASLASLLPEPLSAIAGPKHAALATGLQLDASAPLPPPRPIEFGLLTSHSGAFRAHAHVSEQGGKAALSAPSDNRGLFETFFGAPQASEPQPSRSVLAYAPPSGVLDDAPGVASGRTPRYDRWTAVYDIKAHTVHLPDGTKLEAHSGLGDKLDDPRYVHVKMRGATPPYVYELTLRERLFHGVQALRLTPVDGGDVFGRAGLLAHSYMLGPRGDSNGCVVFKNYAAFLRAFQNGEVKRLAVVANLD